MNLEKLITRVGKAIVWPYPGLQDDVTNAVNDVCERFARREPTLRCLQKSEDMTTESGVSIYKFPADFNQQLTLYRIVDGSRKIIEEVGPRDLIRQKPAFDDGTQNGQPRWWVYVPDKRFQLIPVPDDEYTIAQVYFARPDVIGATAQENKLMAEYPDVVFEGVLSVVYPWRNEPEKGAFHNQKFEMLLDEVVAKGAIDYIGVSGIERKRHRTAAGRIGRSE